MPFLLVRLSVKALQRYTSAQVNPWKPCKTFPMSDCFPDSPETYLGPSQTSTSTVFNSIPLEKTSESL